MKLRIATQTTEAISPTDQQTLIRLLKNFGFAEAGVEQGPKGRWTLILRGDVRLESAEADEQHAAAGR